MDYEILKGYGNSAIAFLLSKTLLVDFKEFKQPVKNDLSVGFLKYLMFHVGFFYTNDVFVANFVKR